MKITILIRTIVFWATVFLSILFLFPIIFIVRSQKKAVNEIEKQWGRLLLFVSGVHLEIKGLENIHPHQSYIIMANHQSYHDIFLLSTLPVLIHWMAKKELFKIPFFGWMLRWIGAIDIDRENRTKTYLSLKKAVEKIRQGATVLIFPEGTRSPTGELLPFKKGGFSLAILSGSPILPVTIEGTHRIMAKGSFLVFPGLAKALIHPPLETKSLTLKDRDWLQEKIRGIFQQNLNRNPSFLDTSLT